MQEPLHKKLRYDLAARINAGELRPGDRLPSERQLVARHGIARYGLVAPAYPLGYRVRGPRMLWLPRLRPLADEPWDLDHIDTTRSHAGNRDAATLGIGRGDPVILRPF